MPDKRALIISPFATWPLDAGQRLRALQTTQFFQDLGYDLTFLLYAFEGAWYWKGQPRVLARMVEQWRDVRVFYSRKQVSEPPRAGDLHQLDEWWDGEFESYLRRLLEHETFEICVVHNVWLSKAFDFLPRRTVKIIDTHDVFSERRAAFEAAGMKPEFFLPDWNDERIGLERADIVLTIKEQEARILEQKQLGRRIINLPYLPETNRPAPSKHDYLSTEKVTFGFLGTDHQFNRVGLAKLLFELNREVRRTFAPVEIKIAGKICDAIDRSALDIRPDLLGYVDDEAEFYDRVDIAIVPVFEGTGFKIKVAELLALGKPMLCAAHASEGVSLNESYVHPNASSMANAMVDIAMHRRSLTDMRLNSERSLEALRANLADVRQAIVSAIDNSTRTSVFIFDRPQPDASCIARLIATVLQARANADRWSIFCIPSSWKADLASWNDVAAPWHRFVDTEDLPDLWQDIAKTDYTVHCPVDDTRFAMLADARNSRRIIDWRYDDLRTMNERQLNALMASAGFMVNHRQVEATRLFASSSAFAYLCAPVLAWEATWEPVVNLVIRKMARRPQSRDRIRYLVCADAVQKEIASGALAALCMEDVVTVAPDDADAMNELVGRLLWSALDRSIETDVIWATQHAKWIAALIDHLAKIGGKVVSRKFSTMVSTDEGASEAVHDLSSVPSTDHAFGGIETRIARLRLAKGAL
ncbi:glycosyltransferase [Rhizobium sp.]